MLELVERNPYAPEEPERIEWDVAVIGTGMGGSTAGLELARLGRRVLFIEKGLFLHGEAAPRAALPGEGREERLRAGYWPERLRAQTSFGELEFFAPLGCGSGGSTTLYAAGLERLAPEDFRPRASFPAASGAALPERWPIQMDDLAPYYARAETLFGVRGTPDPLSGDAATLLPPPALGPRDQHLFDSFRALGLHPYHAHVACDFVPGCTGCAGQACARGCKKDAGRTCLLPAVQKFGAALLTQCEVARLEANGASVRAVHCLWRGRPLRIRARTVVLAAGAYSSPVLLLNSRSADWPEGLANRSGLVGRNLMFHVSDFFAVFPRRATGSEGTHKSLAFNDFYRRDGEKAGAFQSAGAAFTLGNIMQYVRELAERDSRWWMKLASPRPLWWRKLSSPAIRLAALVMHYALDFRSAALWASIVEDLPYHENRVLPDGTGLRFEYRYSEELRNRVQSFRRRLRAALAPHRVLLLTGDAPLNFGHACGTCRFGEHPASSVLDRFNKAHDLSNLYVVDASFFPSSGGTNPSLTIAANALRVAGAIAAGHR